jgi:hypothetical protein
VHRHLTPCPPSQKSARPLRNEVTWLI